VTKKNIKQSSITAILVTKNGTFWLGYSAPPFMFVEGRLIKSIQRWRMTGDITLPCVRDDYPDNKPDNEDNNLVDESSNNNNEDVEDDVNNNNICTSTNQQ
jgi:hypothetical protein